MSCSVNLRNFGFKRDSEYLFRDVNLNLTHKDRVAIVGDNGVGKSTFLKSLVGLREFEGEIDIFHNKLLSESDFKRVRDRVGFLPQEVDDFFLTPSVLEEISFSLVNLGIDNAEERAVEFLKKFNIEHLKDRVPFKLSGGEKKIVALLAILISEPEIILLDEPSNHLDLVSKNRVKEILKSIDKTVIIVSHDLEFVKDIVNSSYELKNQKLIKLKEF